MRAKSIIIICLLMLLVVSFVIFGLSGESTSKKIVINEENQALVDVPEVTALDKVETPKNEQEAEQSGDLINPTGVENELTPEEESPVDEELSVDDTEKIVDEPRSGDADDDVPAPVFESVTDESKQEAIEAVRSYVGFSENSSTKVQFDRAEGDSFYVHVFDVVKFEDGSSHTSTIGWYEYNMKTQDVLEAY